MPGQRPNRRHLEQWESISEKLRSNERVTPEHDLAIEAKQFVIGDGQPAAFVPGSPGAVERMSAE